MCELCLTSNYSSKQSMTKLRWTYTAKKCKTSRETTTDQGFGFIKLCIRHNQHRFTPDSGADLCNDAAVRKQTMTFIPEQQRAH